MAWSAAGRLQAQVNWLTDNRSVDVNGYAQTPPLTVSNYSANAAPPASLSAFNGNISGAADENYQGQVAHGSSQAMQNSSFNGGEYDFDSLVTAVTGGFGSSCSCYAEADSTSEISFTVSSPQTWSLAVDFNTHNGTESASWNLISAQVGSILGSPVQNPNPGGPPLYYEGTLTPGDTYTMTISIGASGNQPDPFGYNSGAGLSAVFLVVPEPKSIALLGTGLISLIALNRRVLVKFS